MRSTGAFERALQKLTVPPRCLRPRRVTRCVRTPQRARTFMRGVAVMGGGIESGRREGVEVSRARDTGGHARSS